MRVWDKIPPRNLCRKHLLGEHRELHAIWNILTKDKEGYRDHPEVKRWVNRLDALHHRHHLLVREMEKRGYNHQSPLVGFTPDGDTLLPHYPDAWDNQLGKLRSKECECDV